MLFYSYSNCNESRQVPDVYQYTLFERSSLHEFLIFGEILDAIIYNVNSTQKSGATP
jgi:hypothetical protein